MTAPRRGMAIKFLSDVIRAEPGYFVVTSGPNSALNGFESFRTPVIAWALERGSFQPYPITLDGVSQGKVSVLLPNGSVECIGLDQCEQLTYSSLALWLEAQKQAFFEEKTS